LPPHSVATILAVYRELASGIAEIEHLKKNILFFKKEISKNALENDFIRSDSAIQSCVIPGNENVKSIAKNLREMGFEVKPILSPTVPKEQERLRFCVHAFNSEKEIREVLKKLAILKL